MLRRTRTILPLGLTVLAAACQQGGSEDKASGEIKLSIDHHMTAIGGKAVFDEGFPLKESGGYTDLATLHFKASGRYATTQPGRQQSREEPYFLEKDGDLTIIVSQTGRAALRWPGFYDLDGDGYFFVSRTRGFLRLFLGVRHLAAKPTTEGAWLVFGDTLVFADKNDKATHDRVGRGFAGTMTVDASDNVSAGSSWKDSSGATVLLSGTVKGSSRGSVDAALTLKGGPGAGTRSFSGGLAKDVGVLIDNVATDGSVGTLVMVRQHTAGIDKKKLIGDWQLCLHAIFNRPGVSGVDVVEGVLTITDDGKWRLRINNSSASFAGTWAVGAAGALTLNESGSNQDWAGAVDEDHRTMVLVDRTTEGGGSTGNPWVGLFFGVRRD